MSISFRLASFTGTPQTHHKISLLRQPIHSNSSFLFPKLKTLPTIKAVHENSKGFLLSPEKPKSENVLSTAASLYPIYVTVGGIVACLKPSAFSWFVKAGPTSYSLSLGLIMLAMGVTLELRDLFGLFLQRPLSVCIDLFSILYGF